MNQIPPHALWIGSTGDLGDWRRLYDLGIAAVVQLAYEEPPLVLPHDLVGCRFPLLDGGDNDSALLRAAVLTLTHLLGEGFTTLVTCQAGQSRSPTIVAAALAGITGERFAVCLDKIAAHHPCNIHAAFFAQVQALCLKP